MSAIRSRGSIPFFNWGSASSPLSATQPNFQLRTSPPAPTTATSELRDRGQELGSSLLPQLRRRDERRRWYNPWGVLANGNLGATSSPPGGACTTSSRAWARPTPPGSGAPTSSTPAPTSRSSTLYPGRCLRRLDLPGRLQLGHEPREAERLADLQPGVLASYSIITGTIAPSKPMVIAETASTEYGGSKAAWITDMLKTQLPLYFPKIKASSGSRSGTSAATTGRSRPRARRSRPSPPTSSWPCTPPTASPASAAGRSSR